MIYAVKLSDGKLVTPKVFFDMHGLATKSKVPDKKTLRSYGAELVSLISAEQEVRGTRNSLLAETDWMALSDNTMSQEWADYRQALRDITSQEGFPYHVTWPTKPNRFEF